jgi:hypothetical protein
MTEQRTNAVIMLAVANTGHFQSTDLLLCLK